MATGRNREMMSKVIGLASTSGRRKASLEQLEVTVFTAPGGPEELSQDLLQIATKKIQFALPLLQALCQEKGQNMSGVVGADTGTAAFRMHQGRFHNELLAKPASLPELRRTFNEMAAHAWESGFGFYQVVSSSVYQNGGLPINGRGVTSVKLRKELTQYLATDEGFGRYLTEFDSFYSGETYRRNGLPAISPLDLSGGLSLPVLLRMGAVSSIDDVVVDGLDQNLVELRTKLAIMNVAVGIAPEILKKIHPDAVEILLDWPWLNEVTNQSLVN